MDWRDLAGTGEEIMEIVSYFIIITGRLWHVYARWMFVCVCVCLKSQRERENRAKNADDERSLQ